VPTDSGLPGWFPEDFNVDNELLTAFEQAPPVNDKKERGSGEREDEKEEEETGSGR
jgi:hypothetical protein